MQSTFVNVYGACTGQKLEGCKRVFMMKSFLSLKKYIYAYIYTYQVQSAKMSPVFFGVCRKLARTKTQQITDKACKHNGRTVFLRVLTCGGVNFVFYTLSSLSFTSSIFAPTSLFSLFHGVRYWLCCRNHDCMYVTPDGTPLPPTPISHPICRGGSNSFVRRTLGGYIYGAVVWIQPLPFLRKFYTIVSF